MKIHKPLLWIIGLAGLLLLLRTWALPALGHLLVEQTRNKPADAAVVLSTGVDYYPRLMEAAAQYRAGRVPLVVINGNRKTDALRELEAMGYVPPAPWDEQAKRILEVLGVPRNKVIGISAEDVFDTISEARNLAPTLRQRGLRRLLVVTSRFHTKRAAHIWRHRLPEPFQIDTAAARRDPFDAEGWWHSGRQIRQLMAEYGGWVFYYWSLWQE
jgi:uncharacterized SAM-binding protein YcdF (DUF218 family)